ncbi:uncharacterized protein MEPE_02068 [Melanopsichium pennsylvanicum]|uniref:Uncharacterized protein n=2 Tax=Melanopsichium pennsylvanicum TaxID=63383 RepID=A0AAJ4XK02_9BASI|nr:putative protein [Melanopsichium pennsylvanicum 4]SNX83361.1 uncharacterized protein MEPE_02068 [Melanopsichium pennsylvanicum]
MASASASPAPSGSSAQHADVKVQGENRFGSVAGCLDEDMGGDATPAAEGKKTPQSINAPQEDSVLAPSFYQDNSSTTKQQTGSRLAQSSDTVVEDDDDDDLMEPEVPAGREERLLDEKIRARYVQEIGDIF